MNLKGKKVILKDGSIGTVLEHDNYVHVLVNDKIMKFNYKHAFENGFLKLADDELQEIREEIPLAEEEPVFISEEELPTPLNSNQTEIILEELITTQDEIQQEENSQIVEETQNEENASIREILEKSSFSMYGTTKYYNCGEAVNAFLNETEIVINSEGKYALCVENKGG